MSDRSAIGWTDSTWSPVTGCTKVSPGCKNCYAERFSERFRGVPGHAFENGFDLQLRPDRLGIPLRWRRPRRVFVCSMSDLFQESVPDEFIVSVFRIMVLAPRHQFQILTKRPERMLEWIQDHWRPRLVPEHVWLGASIERQDYMWRAEAVACAPAVVRFLSCEPLLGPLDLGRVLGLGDVLASGPISLPPSLSGVLGINWVIVGGESGPGFRPMAPEWAESIEQQCRAAGVPVFVKQDSGPRPGKQGRIPDWLWARKDFPDDGLARYPAATAG